MVQVVSAKNAEQSGTRGRSRNVGFIPRPRVAATRAGTRGRDREMNLASRRRPPVAAVQNVFSSAAQNTIMGSMICSPILSEPFERVIADRPVTLH